MGAPNYSTDLIEITLAETVADWSALGGGAAGLYADVDFTIQGTYSVNKQVNKALKGQIFDFGSIISLGGDDHIFVWLYCTTPGLLDTLANGGMRVTIGTSKTAYNEYYVRGAAEYAKGGWINFPIRYAIAIPSPGSQIGSPGADPQWFGGQLKIIDTIKAVNFGVDAMRYGTGIYITGGEAVDPGTFSGAAAQNDLSSNRWGILAAQPGGYALQGRLVIGQNVSKTPVVAHFDDANTLITLIDTPHSLLDFTQIIIDHESTVFNLMNVTILALGISNVGKLVFNNASIVSALIGCTFDSMGDFVLQAAVVATNCIWRSCKLVTQNGALLDGCVISNAKASDGEAFIKSNDPANIKNCQFTFSNGHAIEITTTTGSPFTFQGNKFAGYGGTPGNNPTPESGSSDAAIYNNSGGAITLELTGDYDSPSVRNGVGATTVIVEAVDLMVKVVDVNNDPIENVQVAIYRVSDDEELMNKETNIDGEVVGSYAESTPIDIYIRIRKSSSGTTKYVPVYTTGTVTGGGFNLTVVMQIDDIAVP